MPDPPEPGSENQKKDDEPSSLASAVKWSHIGFALPACTIVGWLLGGLVDKWLGTTWIKTAGLIVGIIAGFAEMIRAIVAISKETK